MASDQHNANVDSENSPGDSFEDFFRREYRSVLALAVVLCGDRNVAEELTMDGFETALRRWPSVSMMEFPGAWVRRVVANRSSSRFRRLAVETRSNQLLSPSDQMVDNTAEVDVWEEVRRLPRRQAQAVALFYLEGYSRSEIASILEVSEESVKTHLERGRRRLAEVWGDTYEA